MGLEDGRQGPGPRLLLALDEHDHADRQVIAVRADGSEMGRDSRLVVGGAAAEQPASPFGRLEGAAGPRGQVTLGLHIVVGVKQHGGLARGRRLPGDHGGEPVRDLDHLRVQALGLEQSRDGGRRPPYLVCTFRVRAHGGDADESLEVGPNTGEKIEDCLPKIA